MGRCFGGWVAVKAGLKAVRTIASSLRVRRRGSALRQSFVAWRCQAHATVDRVGGGGEGAGPMPWKRLEVLKMIASPAPSGGTPPREYTPVQKEEGVYLGLGRLLGYVGGRETRNILAHCLDAWAGEAAKKRTPGSERASLRAAFAASRAGVVRVLGWGGFESRGVASKITRVPFCGGRKAWEAVGWTCAFAFCAWWGAASGAQEVMRAAERGGAWRSAAFATQAWRREGARRGKGATVARARERHARAAVICSWRDAVERRLFVERRMREIHGDRQVMGLRAAAARWRSYSCGRGEDRSAGVLAPGGAASELAIMCLLEECMSAWRVHLVVSLGVSASMEMRGRGLCIEAAFHRFEAPAQRTRARVANEPLPPCNLFVESLSQSVLLQLPSVRRLFHRVPPHATSLGV